MSPTDINLKVKFLEYLVEGMYRCLGPADSEIVRSIKQSWVDEGNVLPVGYELED